MHIIHLQYVESYAEHPCVDTILELHAYNILMKNYLSFTYWDITQKLALIRDSIREILH